METGQKQMASFEDKIKPKEGLSAKQNVDHFLDTFSELKEILEKKISNSWKIEKAELPAHFDELNKNAQELQRFVNESAVFLASFQIKRAQEMLSVLSRSIEDASLELLPRRKFKFKVKGSSSSEVTLKPSREMLKEGINLENKSSDIDYGLIRELEESEQFSFKQLHGETLRPAREDIRGHQLTLASLTCCRVLALGSPSSLQMGHLVDCTVIVGPTSRSAFINECQSCTFVIACHQVRIHNSRECKFFLKVTASVIIEDSSSLHFGPYNLKYSGIEDDYVNSGLDAGVNNWKKIQDFNWLNESEHSPNWDLISEDEINSDGLNL